MKIFFVCKKSIFVCLLLVSSLLQAQTPDGNGIIYVKADGTGNGSSWGNATSSLQGAINAAGVQKVFVAVGTYTVSSADASFKMKNNVEIYGGFVPANNVTDWSTRILPNRNPVTDWPYTGSVLNGLNLQTFENYPVIQNTSDLGLTPSAVLDGFTIAAGVNLGYGGGISNQNASPTLRNLLITGNMAARGGGIYNSNSSPVITDVIINNCVAFTNGANTGLGGAVYNINASPVFINVLVVGNQTDVNNGGAGIYNTGTGTTQFINTTIDNNIAGVNGGAPNAMTINSGTVSFSNSIVYGGITGTYNARYSIIQGNTDFTNGNINASGFTAGDIFVGPILGYTIDVGNYQLRSVAPAIDAGSNSLFPDLTVTALDLAGNSRVKNGNNPGVIDMGAYESQYVPVEPTAGVVYVKPIASGNGSGSGWDDATSDLHTAIHTAGVAKVFVAAGHYYVGSASFIMKNNVAVYGGFDPAHNIKTLSDHRIMPDPAHPAQGSVLDGQGARPVIWNVFNAATAMNNTAVLDGFTITNGKSGENGTGGGIYNEYASPTLVNLVISNNKANYGGGTYNKNSSPKMEHIRITGNSAQWDGGGIYNKASAPSMINVAIMNNKANYGGGVFNQTAPAPGMVNVLITGNSSNNDAGGMYNDDQAIPVLTNTTIAGNNAALQGKAIYNRNASVALYNSIVYGSIAGAAYTAQFSLIEGSNSTADGNIDATAVTPGDIFVNPLAGDYTLKAGSKAINGGSNQHYWNIINGGAPLPPLGDAAWGTDLAGNPRLAGSAIDPGAFEYRDGALPVSFGAFSALVKDGRLLVSWTTVSEANNDHFLVQVSPDGRNWKTVQTVQSRAAGGNSNTGLDYSNAIPLTGLSLGAGFLLLGAMTGRRRRYIPAIAMFGISMLAFSCSKQDIFKHIDNGRLFVRIVQVDKNGTERVSKVIQAVNG
ncbi:beta strand repeat-containing protein [Niabella drilacis]|uniref:Right handed beta helix region n=1 Tax=Niabella drilacis (strain DSM 25811 / CCM 8410 / CCUG 62505 / LMG 26954 / E90) TaxID=1285928 RepID=A0A1G6KTG1_NIADE|nr:choice-of-anchor Q domain-containing protein [Niabella drilacis]SDC34389.1 hypothetical protein SAMN04487894_10299 [Niabella drilacis]